MDVLLIGATGALGQRAVPRLIEAGHTVHAAASSPDRAEQISALGARPVTVDAFDDADVARAISTTQAAAVINIATRIPPLAKAGLPWAWRAQHRLRRTASRAIARAAALGGAEVFIQEGVSFGYADAGGEWITEASPTRYRSAVKTMPDAIAASQVMHRDRQRGVCLLFGRFYGDDVMTRDTYRDVQRGRPVLFGDHEGWTSLLHLDSAAAALVAALNAPSGVYNVGEKPVRKSQVARAYGEAAGREARFYPAVVSRLSPGAEVLSRSQRVSSAAFTKATGWRGQHPDFAASYAQLTRQW